MGKQQQQPPEGTAHGERPAVVRFALRIPAELYRLIQERAQHDQRSINSEILWVLQQALGRKPEE